jgi:SAM-dependent methyltransferase
MSVEQCTWSDVADGWDEWRDAIEQGDSAVTHALLSLAGPLRGARVLELAGGNGELAVRLAAEVGSSGSLLASDEAAGMVRLLTTRLAGLANAEVRRIDACDIPLPDDTYDTVVCRMGLMLVSDPARAAAEIRRVLRPGGRLVAAVWADPAANPWMASVGMAAMMQGLTAGGSPTEPGGPFSLADPGALHALLEETFFDNVRVDEAVGVRRYRSSDEHVDMVRALAPPLNAALSTAPEKLPALRETVRQLTSTYATVDGALELPLKALVCSATA